MSDQILLAVFIVNIVFIIVDASVGYYMAPSLLTLAPGQRTETTGAPVQNIRKMLAGVVTLYMFFNCLAYFRQETTLILIISAIIMVDLAGQIYMRKRAITQTDSDDE